MLRQLCSSNFESLGQVAVLLIVGFRIAKLNLFRLVAPVDRLCNRLAKTPQRLVETLWDCVREPFISMHVVINYIGTLCLRSGDLQLGRARSSRL